MRLRELLHGVEIIRQNVPESLEITGVSCDSREMEKDSIFVAIPGNRCDGGDYALEALKRGAAAVVCQGKPPENLPRGAPLILLPDARKALAHLACNWYGNPAKSLKLIGVTGTNGKTTTTYLIKHILEAMGEKTGLIGTVENRAGEERFPARRTTPNALEIQKILGKMVTNRCKFGVMEVSSHALLQDRTENIPFTVGVFTNLTEDHLDYHKTMEHYCDAKAKLFRHCRTAACNGDDAWRQRILAGSRCPVLLYGLGEEADLRGEDIRLFSRGVEFTVRENEKRIPVQVGVPGRFSVYNTLGAMAACRLLGISAETCAQALRTFPGVRGRMEVVPTPGKPYTLLIDYAHTPDALENVLQTARGFAQGRVIAVFGCGGDREKEKRPRMGQAVARLADFAVVTSDNPRTEDPEAIIRDILPGMAAAAGRYAVEPDRRKAIALAMEQGRAGDVILLCGKGHETYQEIGNETLPMDEREIVRSLL